MTRRNPNAELEKLASDMERLLRSLIRRSDKLTAPGTMCTRTPEAERGYKRAKALVERARKLRGEA